MIIKRILDFTDLNVLWWVLLDMSHITHFLVYYIFIGFFDW